jgi:tetratricopeptide (TPR) repeat protein
MSADQRREVCSAIFAERTAYDKKKDIKSILSEISKHRGWTNGMQFKEIARHLTPEDKAAACFEVAEAHQLSDNFYAFGIREWLIDRHIKDIGLRLDEVGIPNEEGMMEKTTGTMPIESVAKLFVGFRDRPTTYGFAYLGHILYDGTKTKALAWKNAQAALTQALGRPAEDKPADPPVQPAPTAEDKKWTDFLPSPLSMYERALLRSLVEGAINRGSNLKAVEAEQMVRQLIDASPGQPRHCFLLGFAQALHGRALDMIELGATAERDRWHLAGYLLGLARDTSHRDVYSRLVVDAPLLDRLLENERLSQPELIECGVTLAKVLAAGDDHGRLAKLCGLLRVNMLGFHNFTIANAALGLASKLTSEEKYEPALELIQAALVPVVAVKDSGGDEALHDYFLEMAEYQKASVLLGLKKFKEAQAIYSKMIADTSSRHRMGARVWMSLSKAGVNRVEDIFPQGSAEKYQDIIRKLEIVSKEVSDNEASKHRLALICHGLWLQSAKDHKGAIHAFDLALARMSGDSSYRRRKIQQWTQLCRAVSLIRDYEDGHIHDIKVAFQEAKEAGLAPSAWYLLEIVSELGYFDDPELIDLFGQLLPEGSLPDFNKAQWKSGAVKSDPHLQVTYLAWLESSNEPLETKWTQTVGLLRAGWRQGGAAPEDALDFLSFLAFQDARQAARLIALLDELGPSDGMLSQQEIVTLKARLYASSGDLTQAVALLTPLFFGVANSMDGYLQQMALAIYDDIQEMRGDVAPLTPLRQKLLAQLEPDDSLDPDIVRGAGEIVLLYVGGNETQRRYEADIRTEFAETYPNVVIEYYCPGWSSNWNKTLDQIKPRLAGADGLLLSYYVRTMFGRSLRKACPANCPWWGADGHGKASIMRGLIKAAQQAAIRRQAATK